METLIYFSLFGLIFLWSCKEDISLAYAFTGKLIDVNGKSITNATINLSAYYRGGVRSGGGYSRIASAKTNNAGNFKVPFNLDSSSHKLMIEVFADNYFPLFKENIFPNDIQGNMLIQNLTLYKLATIKSILEILHQYLLQMIFMFFKLMKYLDHHCILLWSGNLREEHLTSLSIDILAIISKAMN